LQSQTNHQTISNYFFFFFAGAFFAGAFFTTFFAAGLQAPFLALAAT